MEYTYRDIMFESNEDVPEKEAKAYILRAIDMYPDKRITKIIGYIDGDEIELHYETEKIPFKRIRRITGYLVGDMSKWNDAKRAEEEDRVKHGVPRIYGSGE